MDMVPEWTPGPGTYEPGTAFVKKHHEIVHPPEEEGKE
jgi:hypothetical protein